MIYSKIVTVTFSEMIMIEWLNVFMEITTFNWKMFICFLATIFSYLSTFFFLDYILDIYFIFDLYIFGKVFIIVAICWLPFYLIGKIKYICFRNPYEKLQEIYD